MSDLTAKMRLARIPATAYVQTKGGATLEQLRQPILKSIILDQTYLDRGEPVSYVIGQGEAHRKVPARICSNVIARFSADLVLSGQRLIYTRMAGISRELKRLDNGLDSRPVIPILEYRGDGFIVVADAYNSDIPQEAIGDVCDFLIDHVSLGGGLILAKVVPDSVLDVELTNDFEAMAEKFIQLDVQQPPRKQVPSRT